MRTASLILLFGTIIVLGCADGDSRKRSNNLSPPTGSDVTAHATSDARVGRWISKEQALSGTAFILEADGRFHLGDLQEGREYPDGITGRWAAQEDGMLCLKVDASETCKISEGAELRFSATLRNEGKEMEAMEQVFVRVQD